MRDEIETVNRGWVKLHRSIEENHFLMKDDTCFALFMRLLLAAGRTKGEIAGGKYDLAERFHMNPSKFYRAMLRLEKEGIVNREVNHKYTVYRICNWHKYQSTDATVSEPRANHKRTTSEHLYKNKKEEIKHSDDFLQQEMAEFKKMRKGLKKPLTDYAEKLLRSNLEKMYPDQPEKQKESLRQSIINGWQGVFELKDGAITEPRYTDATPRYQESIL